MIAERYLARTFQESTTLNVLQSNIHGLNHWFRVWENAQALAKVVPGVDLELVAIFALFHDSMRDNDGDDPEHGYRGWCLWRALDLEGARFFHQFNRDQNDILLTACRDHVSGQTHSDPTIGVCWDADRLDLPRVGIIPDPKLMSTTEGARLASRKKHVL